MTTTMTMPTIATTARWVQRLSSLHAAVPKPCCTVPWCSSRFTPHAAPPVILLLLLLLQDDDDDDEAELLAELQRIKAERAEEAARKAAQEAAAREAAEEAELVRGNPLLQEKLAAQGGGAGGRGGGGGGGGGGGISRMCLLAWALLQLVGCLQSYLLLSHTHGPTPSRCLPRRPQLCNEAALGR